MRSYQLIETSAELTELIDFLQSAEVIGVDTEADSLYSYFDKVCLFQFTALGRDFIVDPLLCETIVELAPVFADPNREVVFHAAEYDVLCLRRDYGFEFHGLFDTMTAALLLGYERIGLADLLREHFGVELDKRFQRAQWSQRPLPIPMLDYARLDTHYLAELRELLCEQLEAAGRLDWAREEFNIIARKEWPPRDFDPEGFWRIKGAGRLNARAQAVLRELYIYRDERARALDRPPFKVLGNQALLAIANTRPRTSKKLGTIGGVSSLIVRRMGDDLLAAVERGRAAKAPVRPRGNGSGLGFDPAVRTRLSALKSWRKKAADPFQIQPHILIPNSVLEQVARRGSVDLEQLSEMPDMRQWMLEVSGDALVEAAAKAAS